MRELLSIANQIGELAARCGDEPSAAVLREAKDLLIEADREQGLGQVDDRAALEELIAVTCTKPGHAVVLLDLFGQIWVGYAGTTGGYVAQAPSRYHVLETIDVQTTNLWLSVAKIDPARFPMLTLHAPGWAGPETPTGTSR